MDEEDDGDHGAYMHIHPFCSCRMAESPGGGGKGNLRNKCCKRLSLRRQASEESADRSGKVAALLKPREDFLFCSALCALADGADSRLSTRVQGFQLSAWMDGWDTMMNSLDPRTINQQPSSNTPYAEASLGYSHSPSPGSQSSFVDASSGHSPADSVFADTLDSGAPSLSADLPGFSFNQETWFDDSGNLVGSFPTFACFEKNSAFERNSAGLNQTYPTLQSLSDQQEQQQQRQQWKAGIPLNNINRSALKGTELQGGLSRNGSTGNLSRNGSAGSISSGGSFGGAVSQSPAPPPLWNSSDRSKPAGEKYFPFSQPAPALSVQQQQQRPIRSTVLNWNIQPQQTALQEQPQPTVETEPEDSGLRLVHLLLACAEAIQRGDRISAESTVRKINQAVSMASQQQAGPMTRVAAHFAEALTRRIYGVSPNSQEALLTSAGIKPDSLSELLQFYEICPYLKFAHFTANQSILEAFKGAKYVHVIDFNLNHGLQWPPLIQALALGPGGAPSLRLTGIGPPEMGGNESLREIGMSLAQLAESVKVPFQFRGVVAEKLDAIKPWMLQVCPGEVVAVNSMFQLHKSLHRDASSGTGIDEVLRVVKSLNPKVVAISEQEANHNSLNFLDRFMEALHFYSSMFDSLEASNYCASSSEQMLAEMYLGREICNVVACEGAERTERHETLEQWRLRLRNAGFQQVHMGPNAFKQASMLLTLFSGQGYRVQDNQGCLTLCWHGRPLLAASAWHCAS